MSPSSSSSHRSRQGCIPCKSRKLKCGEERPTCLRCTRSSLKCKYYSQSFKWSTKHELLGDRQNGFQDGRGRPKTKVTFPESSHSAAQSDKDGSNGDHNTQTNLAIDLGDPLTQVDEFTMSLLWPHATNSADSIYWPLITDDDTTNGANIDQFEFQRQTPVDTNLANAEELQHTTVKALNSESAGLLDPSLSHHLDSPIQMNSQNSYPAILDGPLYAASDVTQEIRADMIQPQMHSNRLSIEPMISDDSTILVSFYFRDTAKLFSCYDGKLNPFRTTVSEHWSSSALLYHSLASMAACSLHNHFPQYKKLGRSHRQEAIRLLEEESGSMDRMLAAFETPVISETGLLSLLMLGGTAAWHDPHDLGTHFFNLLAKYLEAQQNMDLSSQSNNKNLLFFQEAMVYWEMLLAYVTDNEGLRRCVRLATGDSALTSPQAPHPWAGVARETQVLVQEVGRLVRRQRKRAYQHRFMTQANIRMMQQALLEAEALERKLITLSAPSTLFQDVINPEDRETPLWHLFTLAELYRCMGLIQLYRVFPDIVEGKITVRGNTLLLDHQGIKCTRETCAGDVIDGIPPSVSTPLVNEWLRDFAVRTVEMLQTIPLESGTRDFQPFLLVALCSELRIHPDFSLSGPSSPQTSSSGAAERLSPPHNRDADFATTEPSIPMSPVENLSVLRARDTILSRLQSFLRILPPRPIHVCIDIVRETWRKMDVVAVRIAKNRRNNANVGMGSNSNMTSVSNMDAESVEIYWMDVMMENGWETIMA